MADQKVSDLPSLNGADVDAADLLYIIDSSAGSAGSKKITVGQYQLAPVSGGTANGVMYLNASKVATAGSDLVFDGSNLGVGTSSPVEKLAVNQGNFYAIRTGGAKLRLADQNNEVSVESSPTGVVSDMIFKTSAATQMTLDSSGNLGLGVTPSANAYGSTKTFFVSGDSANGLLALSEESISATSQYVSLMNNAYPDGPGVYKYKKSSQVATSYRQNDGAHAWFTAPSGTAGNAITFTQAMTLDASGNLGVGATSPSYPLHINKSFSVYGAYLNNTSTSTGDYSVLVATGASSGMPLMMFGAGGTTVGNAGVQGAGYVGTQNNTPLVFVTNDAARARITSGGALVVGNTAVAGFEVLCASNNSALAAPFASWNRATSSDNIFAGWYTEGTATIRGTIDYNRAGGLVRYNTTSDYRAKDIIGPVQNPGGTIDALKVYEGVMKGATQSRPMLIAHEAQEHAPYAVSGVKDEVNEDGTPKFQQIDVSSLVPLLLAEIQSLRARVAALESA